MYLLKKIIGQILMPIPFCFGIIFLGLFLAAFTKRRAMGNVFMGLGAVLFILLANTFVADWMAAGLEDSFAPYQKGVDVPFVVVLSGGFFKNARIPPADRLNCSSVIRLMEGIRIFREQKSASLVISGAHAAPAMAEAAVSLGVDRDAIIIENKSPDTRSQAENLRKIVGGRQFVLVSSALHMPRCVKLFKRFQMDPIPAPTEYLAKKAEHNLYSFIPNSMDLDKAEKAIHEYLGLLLVTSDI